MNITDATVAAASRRATAKRAAFPAVVSVRYDRRVARTVIALASGLELAFLPKHAQGLEDAHPADLMDAEITASGLGVHYRLGRLMPRHPSRNSTVEKLAVQLQNTQPCGLKEKFSPY